MTNLEELLDGWEVGKLGDWEIGGLRSGYQRTNEWASVLGIVTGLRIINSHELMCTAATAAAATTRCCISRKRGYTDYRHRLGLYLNLLSTSWSLSYFGLARKTKLISVAAAASLAFWHRFTCRHLLQITRSLRNCQVLIIPSEKREKITSLPPSCQHRHLSSAPPLPFVQCI